MRGAGRKFSERDYNSDAHSGRHIQSDKNLKFSMSTSLSFCPPASIPSMNIWNVYWMQDSMPGPLGNTDI